MISLVVKTILNIIKAIGNLIGKKNPHHSSSQPSAKGGAKPSTKTSTKSSAKPSTKPSAKTSAKGSAKPSTKISTKSSAKPSTKTSKKSGAETATKTSKKSGDEAATKTSKKSGDEASTKTSAKSSNETATKSGTVTAKPENELDAYREGGTLRLKPTGHPANPREALLELLATYSAASMRTTYYDQGMLKELESAGGSGVDYIDVQFTATTMVQKVHWKKHSVPVADLGVTYDTMVKGTTASLPIVLNGSEVMLVRQMAFSKLIDDVPNAVMRTGRFYL